MKDLVQIWNTVTGRRYSAVNTNDRELRELSNNRLKNCDIDSTAFDANLSECEGLNNKFNDDLDFNERKDAIINRLFERRRKGQVARHPKGLFISLMLGFFALAAAFFILFLHPYDFLFRQKVVLQDGGEIFEIWKKPEVELYIRIFLFNVTNAEDFMAGKDKKVKVKEVGPYVYRETFEHKILRFNDNGTISAIPKHPLTWIEDMSDGHSEDDILFLPHIALLSIANVVSRENFVTRFGLNNVIRLTNSKALVQMTAKEFMMGYKSNLMTLGNTFMPGWIYFDKLGLIDRMYDFEGDYETIFTGEQDVRDSGLIDTYKGSTDLPQWQGKHCSNVQYASDGTKFRGGVDKNETILFFRKSLCRAAPLIPKQEGLKSSLKAYMYTFSDDMLDNGKYNEKNKCFCRKGKCLPNGLIDVADCYYGFPIALSYPHFYRGDDVLSSKVEGLKPNRELHETRFWIQPDSGLPLDVSVKFQINLALEDISTITNTDKFSHMYLPLLWFDIRMYSLPPNLEQRFIVYLNVLPIVEKASMYILFVTGAFLILLTVYRLTFKIMFRNFEGMKKQHSFMADTDLWIDKDKNNKLRRSNKDDIYAPCEVPLNATDSDNSDPQFESQKITFIKTHSDKLKELSYRLGDKVYDSVGSVKDKVKEFSHVKSIFNNERKDSLINPDSSIANDAFKSESSDSEKEYDNKYHTIKQTDSDDDCKYLEIIDDGSEFDEPKTKFVSSVRSNHLKELDSRTDDNHTIVHILD